MIDIRKLKELVRLMVENDLTELDLRDEQETVTVKRPGLHVAPQVMAPQMMAPAMMAPAMHAAPSAAAAAPAASAPAAAAPAAEKLPSIDSPMVGTFYATPSPDSPNFVAIGSTVKADTVVCIIEAMKVMNEIKAEVSGTITEVAAENGQPVQFGQALYRYK